MPSHKEAFSKAQLSSKSATRNWGQPQVLDKSASSCDLILLSSWDYRNAPPCPANFIFLVEMGFLHVGKARLELLTSGDPPALASKMLRLQVLCIKLYVIMPSPFNPEGLHGSGTVLVHR
ncbi:Protein GVQW1 [Plecturocebus cupreus]